MPTKTEARTADKRKQADADRKREKARQELRLEREQALAHLNAEQTKQVNALHAEFQTRRRKIWETFHSGMAKLRRDTKEQA